MDEQVLKVFSRLKREPDGQELISFLEKTSKDNYSIWKDMGGDVLRGKAMAYDYLIKLFETCDDKIASQTINQDEWM